MQTTCFVASRITEANAVAQDEVTAALPRAFPFDGHGVGKDGLTPDGYWFKLAGMRRTDPGSTTVRVPPRRYCLAGMIAVGAQVAAPSLLSTVLSGGSGRTPAILPT